MAIGVLTTIKRFLPTVVVVVLYLSLRHNYVAALAVVSFGLDFAFGGRAADVLALRSWTKEADESRAIWGHALLLKTARDRTLWLVALAVVILVPVGLIALMDLVWDHSAPPRRDAVIIIASTQVVVLSQLVFLLLPDFWTGLRSAQDGMRGDYPAHDATLLLMLLPRQERLIPAWIFYLALSVFLAGLMLVAEFSMTLKPVGWISVLVHALAATMYTVACAGWVVMQWRILLALQRGDSLS